jgi:hypothetical protein
MARVVPQDGQGKCVIRLNQHQVVVSFTNETPCR